MNDLVTIETECDAARVRVSVRLDPEGIAAALDALNMSGEVLRDLFRRRGWKPPETAVDAAAGTGCDAARGPDALSARKGARR